MKKIILAALVVLLASKAEAQTRLLGKIDATKSSVAEQEFEWYAVEAEVEKSFKKNKILLSGFAIGLRREATQTGSWSEGVYLTFRTFRKQSFFKKHPIEVIPSLTVLWGSPGSTLNRASQEKYGEFVPYVNVFPLRNAEVPKFDIENAGLIYPEISVAVRKNFLKIFSIEPVVGIRVIRFGIVEFDGLRAHYRTDMAVLPSVGLKVGLKIH